MSLRLLGKICKICNLNSPFCVVGRDKAIQRQKQKQAVLYGFNSIATCQLGLLCFETIKEID